MSIANHQNAKSSNVITPAKIDWQMDDTGNMVPVSGEFGDVYFSHADGLAETRHVFLAHNQLSERFIRLAPKQCFTIAELGLGTGLNLLATWQLWRQLRDTHPHLADARLHFITTEKFPIPLVDLTHILALWRQRAPELSKFIELLLASYPPLIAGCHRLNFDCDNLTVDMWFGDAADSLSKLAVSHQHSSVPHIDAWFLDGFAPSCNSTLWADSILTQMQRLSGPHTTAATYSCAGIVKRGLREHGFQIKKVKGFGRKREMLTAVMIDADGSDASHNNDANNNHQDISHDVKNQKTTHAIFDHTVVIGAGLLPIAAWLSHY